MEFAARLRIAMCAKTKQKKKSIGAQYIFKETKGKLSATHISKLVDARIDPTDEDIELLSKVLNVPSEWLKGDSNSLPLIVSSYCRLNNIDLAAFNGMVDENDPAAIEYLCALITHKENQ